MQSLPYPIPGPAGATFSNTQCESERCLNVNRSLVDTSLRRKRRTTSHSNSLQSFDITGWHALLHAYDLRPYGPDLLSSSIALIKSNAIRGDFQRLRLAVLVEKMHFVGLNASVTLADPTGTIVATVLAEVFEDRKCGIEEGAVLMLTGVTAIMYPERKPAGFYINLDASLHMSIQSSNIVHVFGSAIESEVERKDLVLPYSEEALRQPNLDQQTLRKQRSAVPDANQPCPAALARPHSEYERPIRNEYRGRPEFSRSHHQQRSGRGMQTPPLQQSNSNQYRRNSYQRRGGAVQGPPRDYASRSRGPYRPLRQDSDVSSRPQLNRNMNKRPGVGHSSMSRPNQRPRTHSIPSYSANTIRQPLHVTENNKSADNLTDDQLDDLLGSVDIDAAIAASQPAPSSGKENKTAEYSNERAVAAQTGQPSSNDEINHRTERPSPPSKNKNANIGSEILQPPPGTNNTTDTLTDDQLDNLLGSVDMDVLLNG